MGSRLIKWMSLSLVLLLFFALTGCGTGKNNEPAKEASKATAVDVVKITKGTIVESKEFSGKLKPLEEVAVGLKLPGKVLKVYGDIGDEVKAGDLLMELDPSDVNLQVKQAQAAYNTAATSRSVMLDKEKEIDDQKAELEKKAKESQRTIAGMQSQLKDLLGGADLWQQMADPDPAKMEDLLKQIQQAYSEGKISLDQFNQINAYLNATNELSALQQQMAALNQAKASLPSIEISNAQVKQAQVGVDMAKAQLKNTKVTAPIDGIIAARNVDEGEIASQAMPPFTIVDIRKVVLEFGVTDMDVVNIQKGMKTSVQIDALKSEKLEGTVTMVSPAPDPRTGSYTVRIELDNADGQIKAGMFARTALDSHRKENIIIVPVDSILDENGEKAVFINQNGLAHKVIIETGISDGTSVEVVKGLKEGDEIVVKGQEFLTEGNPLQANRGEGK